MRVEEDFSYADIGGLKPEDAQEAMERRARARLNGEAPLTPEALRAIKTEPIDENAALLEIKEEPVDVDDAPDNPTADPPAAEAAAAAGDAPAVPPHQAQAMRPSEPSTSGALLQQQLQLQQVQQSRPNSNRRALSVGGAPSSSPLFASPLVRPDTRLVLGCRSEDELQRLPLPQQLHYLGHPGGLSREEGERRFSAIIEKDMVDIMEFFPAERIMWQTIFLTVWKTGVRPRYEDWPPKKLLYAPRGVIGYDFMEAIDALLAERERLESARTVSSGRRLTASQQALIIHYLCTADRAHGPTIDADLLQWAQEAATAATRAQQEAAQTAAAAAAAARAAGRRPMLQRVVLLPDGDDEGDAAAAATAAATAQKEAREKLKKEKEQQKAAKKEEQKRKKEEEKKKKEEEKRKKKEQEKEEKMEELRAKLLRDEAVKVRAAEAKKRQKEEAVKKWMEEEKRKTEANERKTREEAAARKKAVEQQALLQKKQEEKRKKDEKAAKKKAAADEEKRKKQEEAARKKEAAKKRKTAAEKDRARFRDSAKSTIAGAVGRPRKRIMIESSSEDEDEEWENAAAKKRKTTTTAAASAATGRASKGAAAAAAAQPTTSSSSTMTGKRGVSYVASRTRNGSKK